MGLWQSTYNATAFAGRKRYYRHLLRGLRRASGDVEGEVEEFFALPGAR